MVARILFWPFLFKDTFKIIDSFFWKADFGSLSARAALLSTLLVALMPVPIRFRWRRQFCYLWLQEA